MKNFSKVLKKFQAFYTNSYDFYTNVKFSKPVSDVVKKEIKAF